MLTCVQATTGSGRTHVTRRSHYFRSTWLPLALVLFRGPLGPGHEIVSDFSQTPSSRSCLGFPLKSPLV